MKRTGSIFVVLGWLVFVTSLAMPAVRFDNAEPIMGWMAGLGVITQIPYFYVDWNSFLVSILGLGNILVAAAPGVLFFSANRSLKVLSLFCMVVFLIAISIYFGSEGYAEGYFLWVVSFLGVALGFGLISSATLHNE